MQFTTIEIEVEADGEQKIDVVVPRFGDGDTRTVLILIEQLDGDKVDFDSWVEADGVPPTTLFGRIRAFGGRLADRATDMTVWLQSRARARFRVFIGWVSRKMREMADRLPCTGCKAVIRAGLKAGLAAVGVPAPDGAEAKIAAEAFEKLFDANICGYVAEFVDEALGKGAWDRIWREAAKMIDPIHHAYKMIDGAFETTCRWLGFCP
ncbi:hypothetical protein [Sphingosinicella sp. YJ22]|uniref:hypothetical protein n=1 Tax=Sphingosinicella sp. YJ22 TaxID=1104780 RepID=UPI00140C430E|nr:hypothetical protein [Sphingosinicella sp. YJ22]